MNRLTLYLGLATGAGLVRLIDEGWVGELSAVLVVVFAVAALYEVLVKPLRARR